MLPPPCGWGSRGTIERLVVESLLEKCLRLERVDRSHTSCGGGLRATGHALQLDTRQVLRQLQRDERPRTLVGRLVLYPAELGVRVVGQSVADAVERQRVQHLQTDDGDVVAAILLALLLQLVVDLAGAHQDGLRSEEHTSELQ